MGNLIEDLMGTLGGDITSQLSNAVGIDQNTAAKLIPAVAPMILAGLKKQKDEFGGTERVDHILNKYGSASVLDNLGELFNSKAKDENADPRLGGLLGDAGVQASNLISKQFNVDGNTATKIIPMLAPVILGFLTKKRDQEGLGSNGIASLLDQDGDGSILDDVAGFLMQGLGGSSSGGGILGGLLGGLFGSKK